MLRLLGFLWSLPTTLIGWLIGFGSLCIGGGYVDWSEGWVTEFVGGLYGRWMKNFSATTFGFVTLYRRAEDEYVRIHERVHTRQAMWLGPFFLPAYGLASVWSRLRHGNWYWNNWFEEQARKQSGLA